MKYFIEPFRYSLLSQLHNGGNISKINPDVISDMKRISNSGKHTIDKKELKELKEAKDEITSSHKWIISIMLGFIFFILASPMFMNITNYVIKNRQTKGFNVTTLLINTIIFILFVRIILQ